MIPFTTAERKVLGVAAPSQQQAPSELGLSVAAQSLQPSAATDGICEPDHVQATDAARSSRRSRKSRIF